MATLFRDGQPGSAARFQDLKTSKAVCMQAAVTEWAYDGLTAGSAAAITERD